MRAPGTMACPMCHTFDNAVGNTVTEGRLNQYGDDDSIWYHFLFSCCRHIWAIPKDVNHPLHFSRWPK